MIGYYPDSTPSSAPAETKRDLSTSQKIAAAQVWATLSAGLYSTGLARDVAQAERYAYNATALLREVRA